ncbi:MAG TPA: hypothetical protein VFW29_03560 [Solirubrobacteraceae bacterium]|nr:hypothetical protein [Solirubrobacteraceae bacterium]
MTRTDVMASSRPLTPRSAAGARRSKGLRALLVLPVLLLAFVLVMPAAAVAAGESTSGYSTKPEEPKTGTSPSGEKSPEKEAEPSKETSPAPAKGEKASTLPFTGFDLRWSLVVGVVLMGAGFSIVIVQRRQHRSQR